MEHTKSRNYRNTGTIPQADTPQSLYQEGDTQHLPQDPICNSLYSSFPEYVPSRFQYPQNLDDLPELVTASTNDNDIDESFPGNLSHLHDTTMQNKYSRCRHNCIRRHDWISRHREPLADEEDNFVVSMSAFFVGYRPADATRYADIANFIKEWDGAWDKISRKAVVGECTQ